GSEAPSSGAPSRRRMPAKPAMIAPLATEDAAGVIPPRRPPHVRLLLGLFFGIAAGFDLCALHGHVPLLVGCGRHHGGCFGFPPSRLVTSSPLRAGCCRP